MNDRIILPLGAEETEKSLLESISEKIDELVEAEESVQGTPRGAMGFGDSLAIDFTHTINSLPGAISRRELIDYHRHLVAREGRKAEEGAVTSEGILREIKDLGLSDDAYSLVEEAVIRAYETKR